jgi:hypothetical protein
MLFSSTRWHNHPRLTYQGHPQDFEVAARASCGVVPRDPAKRHSRPSLSAPDALGCASRRRRRRPRPLRLAFAHVVALVFIVLVVWVFVLVFVLDVFVGL